MLITKSILWAIAPQAKSAILDKILNPLNEFLPKYGITTRLRVCHFLAQAAHETAGFATLDEYGGDVYFNRKYDQRTDLGNTPQLDGDGALYHGRGIFQLTGKDNYRIFGGMLGIDLVNNPARAADGPTSVQIACLYWNQRNLSALADINDIRGITKKINGGYNGLADRQTYLDRAFKAIPEDGPDLIPAQPPFIPPIPGHKPPVPDVVPVTPPAPPIIVPPVSTEPKGFWEKLGELFAQFVLWLKSKGTSSGNSNDRNR